VTGFRVEAVETVATGGFLELVEAQVAAPGDAPGAPSLRRFVVRHPGAVVVVPVDADLQHVFCVRQYRVAIDAELLEVPAGKRDVEGEAPADTARRELEEEIGRRAGRIVPLGEFYNSPGFTDEYTHLFCALDLEELPERATVTAEEDHMTIERVPLARLDEMIAAREIVDAKTIIGLALTRALLAAPVPPEA